jgi:hypothetical protein
MGYEELRKKYQEHISTVIRLKKLNGRAKSGELLPDRLLLCNKEIARLGAETKQGDAFFTHLEEINDPNWRKITRELNTTLEGYVHPDAKVDVLHGIMKGIGIISTLIIGTWAIDSWRKK